MPASKRKQQNVKLSKGYGKGESWRKKVYGKEWKPGVLRKTSATLKKYKTKAQALQGVQAKALALSGATGGADILALQALQKKADDMVAAHKTQQAAIDKAAKLNKLFGERRAKALKPEAIAAAKARASSKKPATGGIAAQAGAKLPARRFTPAERKANREYFKKTGMRTITGNQHQRLVKRRAEYKARTGTSTKPADWVLVNGHWQLKKKRKPTGGVRAP